MAVEKRKPLTPNRFTPRRRLGTRELTTDVFEKFRGGQMTDFHIVKGYFNRGEIETIFVKNGLLRVTFTWRAKGIGLPTEREQWISGGNFPPKPKGWIANEDLFFSRGIFDFYPGGAGPSSLEDGGGARLFIRSDAMTRVLMMFYPPDGERLDPAEVAGLKLAR